MCELEVLLEGKVVFKDAVYAKADGNKVILRDALGASRTLGDCRILEIDVGSELLILSQTKE